MGDIIMAIDNKETENIDNKDEKVDSKGDRFFLGEDEETKYYITPPTADAIRGADWQYSKIYTKCLMGDIPTSAEMLDILTRRGIIGPEFEQRAAELAQILNQSIEKLETCSDLDDKRTGAVDVATAREELFQWNQRLNGPMNNTSEQISDDARLEYLTSCMIVDESGAKVWKDYDRYLEETNQALALKSRYEVMLYVQGLDPDFLNQTPEAKAMHEVESEVIEKAKEAIEASKAVAMEELEESRSVEKISKDDLKAKKTTSKLKPKGTSKKKTNK